MTEGWSLEQGVDDVAQFLDRHADVHAADPGGCVITARVPLPLALLPKEYS